MAFYPFIEMQNEPLTNPNFRYHKKHPYSLITWEKISLVPYKSQKVEMVDMMTLIKSEV